MQALVHKVEPDVYGAEPFLSNLKPTHVTCMHPGRVGSVGQVNNLRGRIRQSSPDMQWTAEPYWDGPRGNKLGSNVQDGDTKSYDDQGKQAKMIYANWPGNNSFMHQYGTTYHNVQHPDLLKEPRLSWLGDFSWRRKLATTTLAKRNGRFFAVKPNGYTPNGPVRGGNYPVAEGAGGDQGPAGAGVETDNMTRGAAQDELEEERKVVDRRARIEAPKRRIGL